MFYKKWDQDTYNSAFAAASPLICAHPEATKGKYIEGDYGTGATVREGSGHRNGRAMTEKFMTEKGLR
jgi:hypothetical protein